MSNTNKIPNMSPENYEEFQSKGWIITPCVSCGQRIISGANKDGIWIKMCKMCQSEYPDD